MTKRKASDICMSPSQPNFHTKIARFHHTIPTWQQSGTSGEVMMTSPPPVRRPASALYESSVPIIDSQPPPDTEMEMCSPTENFWRAMCSPSSGTSTATIRPRAPSLRHSTTTTTAATAPLPEPPSPHHPLCPPKLVPQAQLDAVLSEVSSLKQTIAWLTRELDESRAQVARLAESQRQQQQQDHDHQAQARQTTGTPLSTGFQPQPQPQHHPQQPVYFAPHQFVPMVHNGS